MTLEQMDSMTAEEIKAFSKKCCTFSESQSLEDYAMNIRDTIYLWRFTVKCCKWYTFDYANELVTCKYKQIERLYEEKEPAAYAAVDIDYCCG